MYGYSDAAGFGPAINFYAFFNAVSFACFKSIACIF